MRKMTKEPDEHDIQSAGGSMETAKRLRFDVMSYTLNLMVTMLLPYPSDKSRECEQLVRIWINEGLFSALEETIDSLVTIRGMTSKSIFHQVILGSSAFRSGVFTPVLHYQRSYPEVLSIFSPTSEHPVSALAYHWHYLAARPQAAMFFAWGCRKGHARSGCHQAAATGQ